MSTQSQALWHTAVGVSAHRSGPIESLQRGQARVRTIFSGVSRGTEALVLAGQVPPSLWRQMAAPHQEGEFSFPLKYGYCSVGVVQATRGPGPEVGARVFCLYPHQDLYQVPSSALTHIPPGVPSARAVLAGNLETALNAVWDAAPGPGDKITVVGAGVVGALTAWICAGILGTRVCLVDTDPNKATLAAKLGIAFSDPDGAQGEQDLVIHCSASQAGLSTSLSLAGTEALVLELSWYGTRSPSVPLGLGFHHKRLTLRSSQVGGIPPLRRPRWDYERRMGVVMQLLHAPELDALLEPPVRFSELPARFADLCGKQGLMCQVISYQEEGSTDV